MECDIDFQIQDEAERLLNEIELMMKNVENSKLYAEMRLDLEQNETFQQYLFRVLGSHSHVQVVILALGSIECYFASQFQLAIILLLKRDFSNWIGNIEIYDPEMSPVDIIVFKKLGLEVLSIDEKCKRTVRRPTLFYMPCPCYFLIGNLLGANWSTSCIKQLFLLTNSFRSSLPLIRPEKFHIETIQRLKSILPFTTEIEVKNSYDMIWTDLFSEFAWHFFDIGSDIDLETCLPETETLRYRKNDKSWSDNQRSLEKEFMENILETDLSSLERAQYFANHRGPRHLRCNSAPPPAGWIKLNIYGIGTKGDLPGRYSGIFRGETGTCLGMYNGTIDIEDDVIAGLEALRNGLVRCAKGKPEAKMLIVESDNVILVQYVNGHPEPKGIIKCLLEEIFKLIESITCTIYHVYEEGNKAARDLSMADKLV